MSTLSKEQATRRDKTLLMALLRSGLRMAQSPLGNFRRPFHRLRKHPWMLFWSPIRKDNN